jgi:hypothetical protein
MYGDAAYRLHHTVDPKTRYPFVWPAVKDEVRAFAKHRCIRCGHPYRVGQETFWSEPAPKDTVQETAALSLFDAEPTDEPRVKRERPVHWSPCDEHCTHSGLIRVREIGGEWQVYDGDAGPLTVLNSVEKQAAWRILTVHHANGRKADLRWFNLLALCQRCHLSVQSRVQMERIYPFEHTDWFKPYVAAFYALKYLNQELGRPEAEARQDELLALERHA